MAVERGAVRLSFGWSWEAGVELAGALGGALILAGFLTPLAALWVSAPLALSWLFATTEGLDALSALLILSHCAALSLLGPGAWSVDARLFGRREILIPREKKHGRQ